jgi:hypothetical protein
MEGSVDPSVQCHGSPESDLALTAEAKDQFLAAIGIPLLRKVAPGLDFADDLRNGTLGYSQDAPSSVTVRPSPGL